MADDTKPTGLNQDRRGTGYHYPDADPGSGTSESNPKTYYNRQYYGIKSGGKKQVKKGSGKS